MVDVANVPIALPAGGLGVILIVTLRMLWVNDIARGRVERQLRDEWAADKAATVAYFEGLLTRQHEDHEALMINQGRLHKQEIEFLQRRIDRLEAEVARHREEDR